MHYNGPEVNRMKSLYPCGCRYFRTRLFGEVGWFLHTRCGQFHLLLGGAPLQCDPYASGAIYYIGRAGIRMLGLDKGTPPLGMPHSAPLHSAPLAPGPETEEGRSGGKRGERSEPSLRKRGFLAQGGVD